MNRLLLALGLAAALIATAALPAFADPPGGGVGQSWHGDNGMYCLTMADWQSRGRSPDYVYANYQAAGANGLYCQVG